MLDNLCSEHEKDILHVLFSMKGEIIDACYDCDLISQCVLMSRNM